jgi:hypothetical protein
MFDVMFYAVPPGRHQSRHVGNLWDENDVTEEVRRLLAAGFTDIQIKIKPCEHGKGRVLRFKYLKPPGGRWENYYLEEDIETIARARRQLTQRR